jgi:hypothetical protein
MLLFLVFLVLGLVYKLHKAYERIHDLEAHIHNINKSLDIFNEDLHKDIEEKTIHFDANDFVSLVDEQEKTVRTEYDQYKL